MNNEEILAAAQKEKNRGKEFENHEAVRSAAWGAVVSALLAVTMFFFQYFVKGTVNVGLLAVSGCSVATQYLYEGKKTGKKRAWIIGIVFCLLTLLFLGVYISQLFSKVWMV